MPHRVYIAIGSNLGDRRANCREARKSISELPDTRVVTASSYYESEPHGDAKTWFVNRSSRSRPSSARPTFSSRPKKIEDAMGRKRVKGKRWGSRVIDLDILFFDNEILNKRNLKIPHPRLAKRRFVLAPLAELAPQLIHPTLNVSVSELLATVQDTKRIQMMIGP